MHARSRPFRLRAAGGFSLVEVLIVLLVLMIAGALAVPMIGQTDDAQLRSAARLLAADLDFARVGSITHSDAPRVVVFDTASEEYHIATEADPGTPLTDPVTKQDYITRFGAGRAAVIGDVGIESHDLDGDDQLGFGIYGQLDQGDPATITLATDTRTVTVTVDPVSGEATIGNLTSR
ncbi:MAG: hypothetical protein ACODAQ_07510 [Phycisphaeraceae bacterium]